MIARTIIAIERNMLNKNFITSFINKKSFSLRLRTCLPVSRDGVDEVTQIWYQMGVEVQILFFELSI
jgi:hypothetical protein